MEAIAGTKLRRAAGASAAAAAALVGGLPLLIGPGVAPLEGGLALAASLTAILALTRAPWLLAPAITLYGTEVVISVHRDELAVWSTPLLAVGLLFFYEAGELRHRLPAGSIIDPRPLRALTRRIVVTVTLGFVAAVVVLSAASLSSNRGVAAGVLGGACAAVAVLLVRTLAVTA